MICKWLKKLRKQKVKTNNQDGQTVKDGNIDFEKPDDNGIEEVIYEDGGKELYYPEAIRYEESMRTRGNYKYNYPQGAVIHFTSGRSRNKEYGGKRNQPTHYKMGKQSVENAIEKGSYCYFVIDRDGTVHQAFKLSRWGYHAGKSKWNGLRGSVSDELVGIEIQSAGKLEKKGNKDVAWFTRIRKGDKDFQPFEIRKSENKDNIQRGTYHAFSQAQEHALTELLLWLKRNNPHVFKLSNVVGHDEVAPNRKSDPGASLSKSMPDYRDLITDEYILRYGEI